MIYSYICSILHPKLILKLYCDRIVDCDASWYTNRIFLWIFGESLNVCEWKPFCFDAIMSIFDKKNNQTRLLCINTIQLKLVLQKNLELHLFWNHFLLHIIFFYTENSKKNNKKNNKKAKKNPLFFALYFMFCFLYLGSLMLY